LCGTSLEAASTPLPINRFEISDLKDILGTCRNTPEALPGGRQQTPTAARKTPPVATPTVTDRPLPMILPILPAKSIATDYA
ncbi:hypothetical protein, partial [Paraburkholderia sp. UYCP14C]|uniref:hypothetical protein n=1 Tax=Paraburkholderia sp. UYCP14C TaxID=2511130 RepID=UPI001B7D62A5